ncbi:DUF975 family protein [Lapidilactobacillus wuchangensis]|uniref:DUF975 family protein n=1 Tax=Lapidilactobacillus wuchangensis TaxID=2486001 RepID=UPI000F7996C7|nr:DUF975 family protein [Lapidilactobacillus wuchangensis]
MIKKHKTRGELKREVKDAFRGNWLEAIKLNLVPVLLGIIVLIMIGVMAGKGYFYFLRDSFNNFEISNIRDINTNQSTSNSSVFGGFIASLVTTGIMYTSLNWLRTKQVPESSIKGAFAVFTKKYFIGVFATTLLLRIFTFLWTLLLIIPGIVKNYAYSQANFVFKDLADSDSDQSISYLDCITKSRQLMVGNKWRLFVLQLSFIGWDILACLTLGIGFLWLIPYQNATYAAFYKDLVD